MDLLALLRAFYGDSPSDDQAALLGLVERVEAADYDEATGRLTYPEGATPLTGDELAQLQDGLAALAEDDEAGVTLLNAAVGVNTQARTEGEGLVADAEAEEAERQAAIRSLRGEPDPAASEGGDGEDGGGDDDGDTPDPNDPPPVNPATGEPEGAPTSEVEPEPVLAGSGATVDIASLARRTPPAHRPAPAADVPEQQLSRISFAAGVDTTDLVPAGQRVRIEHVNEATTERFQAFAQSGHIMDAGIEEKIRVARFHANFAQERRLIDASGRPLPGDVAADVVAAVYRAGLGLDRNVLAAGGFCAPFVPLFGVDVMGTTVRPLRDQALSSFQATRGGVISLPPPRLAQVLPAVGIWTEQNDIDAAGGSPTKSCLRITCNTPLESQVEAIYVCLTFGNLTAITFQEWTSAWSQLSMVAHARVAEQRIWSKMQALGTQVNAVTSRVSATRDLLNTLARAAAAVRLRNRELRTFPFRAVLPTVALDIMVEDLASGMASAGLNDTLAVAEARINSWFAARNINVTYSPDLALIGEQGASTVLANYPTAVPWMIYPEGGLLHLDSGTLDFGIVRDSALIAANDYKTFMETFEGVHRLVNAQDVLHGTINLCPTGGTYGTLDPAGRCAQYT